MPQLGWLAVSNFRSYTRQEWEPEPGINCLAAPNGSGKTNLLEAIYWLCTTRGFHTERDAVRQGETWFMLESRWQQAPFRSLSLGYQHGRGKKLLADGDAVKPLHLHVGRLPVVHLLPQHTALITEGGAERRLWLDGLLSQARPAYLPALLAYQAALEQRNALLHQAAETGRLDHALLEPYDYQLRQHGAVLWAERRGFLTGFVPLYLDYYRRLADGQDQPGLVYRSQFVADAAAEWSQLSQQMLRRETGSGRTLVGIHRDDVALSLNGGELRAMGSQGQWKTCLLALKLAQYHYLAGQTGVQPLLLLDDVFDRLDTGRMQRLAAVVQTQVGGQVFVTDAVPERLQAAFGTGGAALSHWQLGAAGLTQTKLP